MNFEGLWPANDNSVYGQLKIRYAQPEGAYLCKISNPIQSPNFVTIWQQTTHHKQSPIKQWKGRDEVYDLGFICDWFTLVHACPCCWSCTPLCMYMANHNHSCSSGAFHCSSIKPEKWRKESFLTLITPSHDKCHVSMYIVICRTCQVPCTRSTVMNTEFYMFNTYILHEWT